MVIFDLKKSFTAKKNVKSLVYVFLFLIFLFSPFFELKIITFLSIVLYFYKRNHIISKTKIFLFLFTIFSFAFIYSPYWHAFVTNGFLKYLSLTIVFFVGIWWANASSSQLKLPQIKKTLYLPFFYIVLYFMNYRILSADIAYRGDEDYHINLLLTFFDYGKFFLNHVTVYIFTNPLFWFFCLLIVILLSYLMFFKNSVNYKSIKVKIFVGSIFLVLIPLSAALLFPENIFRDHKGTYIYDFFSGVLRYPFFQKWMNLLFVFPNLYGDIKLYRAVPFLSLLFLATFLFFSFDQKLKSKMLSFCFTCAICTVPVIFFYSNILYLEMPIFLLMVLCVFHIKKLIKSNFSELQLHPVWYCLLLLGFLKETTAIFLLLIILLRVCYQLAKSLKKQKNFGYIFSEIKLSLLILLPVLIFIPLRGGPKYVLFLQNAVNFKEYEILTKALLEQEGGLFLIAIISILYLFLKRKIFIASTTLVLFFGILFFLLNYVRQVDISIADNNFFVGYSRLYFFLLPTMLYLSYLFITSMKKYMQIILLLCFIFINIVLLPFHSDGVRKPNWGSPVADAAEYTYPYEKAVAYLSQKHVKKLAIIGQYYQYSGLEFYLRKYSFAPTIKNFQFGTKKLTTSAEKNKLYTLLQSEEIKNFNPNYILYHQENKFKVDAIKNYSLITVIKNSEHSLYIFKKL